MSNEENIHILKELIHSGNNIVFFGGAGTSTECGIPDFRSDNGLYSKKKYGYDPETIISSDFFGSNPDIFYRYYKEAFIYKDAKPNEFYFKLAELEKQGKLKAVITQNVDGLHTAAGSKNVLELHGCIYRNYCTKCHTSYPLEKITNSDGVPTCDRCGGIIKPDVVLYGECLNEKVMDKAVKAIAAADILLVGGTSLSVYPAAGLINYYQGSKLVLINRSTTPYDSRADLIVTGSINEIFKNI